MSISEDLELLIVPEAEEMVCGAIVKNGVNALISVAPYLKPEYFYREALGEVYGSAVELSERGNAVDAYTIAEELRRRGMYEAVGGILFLEKLVGTTLKEENIETYARIIRDMAGRRTLITNLQEAITTAKRRDLDIDSIMSKAESLVSNASEIIIEQDFEDMPTIMDSFKQRILELESSPTQLTGVPSGFPEIDQYTLGWQDSSLIICAALAGTGKTAFLLNLLLNGVKATKADGTNYRGAMFSIEMDKDELSERLVSIQSGIDAQTLRKPKTMTSEQRKEMAKAISFLENLEIIISDKEELNVSEIRTKVRKANKKKKIDFLLIDYLQLVDGSGKKFENRQAEVSEVTHQLKVLARKLKIPVICAAQLAKTAEQRPDKRGRMEDLRESGRIGQEANLVIFVHRQELYDVSDEWKDLAEIYAGKHRRGPLFSKTIRFYANIQRFESLEGADLLRRQKTSGNLEGQQQLAEYPEI